jgi:F-box/leucine-rich repeat protein 2/20
MKHPQGVDSSSDDGQVPLKPSLPSPSPSASPSPVCTPSAHQSMPHHTLSEHPDLAPSGSAPIDVIIPTHHSDLPTSFFPPPPSLLIEFTPFRPLCDSPPQDDHALSNLPGPSIPFDAACPNDTPASLTDKGKAKEPPPTLPPLSLSPSDLGYNIDDWSSTAGPSSSWSTCASLRTASSRHSPPSSIESTVVHADEPPTLTKVPSRTRSLSNLSVRSTTPSMSKIRIKFAASSKAPVNLARRLLSRNKADAAGPSETRPANDFADPLGDDLMPIETGNCLFPWQAKDITRASSPLAGVETQVAAVAAPDVAAFWYPDNHHLDGVVGPRKKSHSYSSPFPKSAFDVVPQVDFEDRFIPLPLYARDLFDEMLPRELRIRVLSAVISLHEADHEQLKNSGKWSVLVASSSKNRWVGRNRAMRELVKLSRVGIVDSCPVDPVNQS